MKIQRISIAMFTLLIMHSSSHYAMQRIQNFLSGLTGKSAQPTVPKISEAQAKLNNALLEAMHDLRFKRADTIDTIKKLLAQGANPNAQDSSRNNPLYLAIREKNPDVVKLLLENKADPNLPGSEGDTPLMHLTKYSLGRTRGYDKAELLAIAPLLLRYGANINTQNSHGYPPDDYEGDTPLHYAVRDNALDVMKFFLENKADPTIPNKEGITPLMEVWNTIYYPLKTERYISALSLLLDRAANPNMQNNLGNTVLLYAVEKDIPEAVKLLLDKKADPTIKNKAGKSVIDMAFEQDKYPLLALFAKAGFLDMSKVDIEKVNADGETLLMQELALNKPLKDIQALIQLGANPYAHDAHGLTAFDYTRDPMIRSVLQTTQHTPTQVSVAPSQPEEKERAYQSYNPQKKTPTLSARFNSIYNSIVSTFRGSPYERAEGHTTSEVYADMFRSRILVNYSEDIEQNKIDILTLLARERDYFDDYYVFYHAQNAEHRIAQDFWLEILALTHTEYPKDFIPVRFWGGQDILSTSDPKTFLTSTKIIPLCGTTYVNKYNDNQPEIRRHLLSVNIALFGNMLHPGSCTFDYYLRNRSMHKVQIASLLEEVATFFDFKRDLVNTITSSQSLLMSSFGNLLQIFIPKQLVDQCVYLAIPWGCAYTQDLGVGGYEFIGDYGYQAKISRLLETLERGKIEGPADPFAQTRGIVTKKFLLNGDVLEPLQARIIIGTDIILNPNKGIKIFREVNLPKAKLEAYQREIRKIARDVIIDWLSRLIDGKISKEVIARLAGTPLAEVIKDPKKAQQLLDDLMVQAIPAKL